MKLPHHVVWLFRRLFGCFMPRGRGDSRPSPPDLSPPPPPVTISDSASALLHAQDQCSVDTTTPPTSVEVNSLLVPTPRSRSRRSSSSSRQVQADPDNDQPITPSSQLRGSLIKAYETVRHLDAPEPFKFVPISALTRLVCLDTVREIIEELSLVERDQVDREASLIVETAPRLFAILIVMEKEADVFTLLRQGLRDSDLPFVRERTAAGVATNVFQTRDGRKVFFPVHWDEDCLNKVESKQARMLVPVFRRREYRNFVGPEQPPFVDWEEDGTAMGSFSEVFKARIHPDHHEFDDYLGCESDGPLVAVKKLVNGNDEAFEIERRIHQHLNANDQHPHFVTLLCTYRRLGRYHMVFPWANGTLRSYWQNNAIPTIDRDTMLWNLKQIAGLANGLSWLHAIAPAAGNPDLYGRHGDIKAANILYFATYPGCDDPRGVLQITDLGLARLHTQGSRSNEDPRHVVCPSTYAPPDGYRGVRISRKWDIWSQGCMYLEWVTWLLCGYDAVLEFGDARGQDFRSFISTDLFFSFRFCVQPSVYEWVENLHQHPKCSQMLHELLDFIMSHMIVIEPSERLSAEEVLQRLNRMLARSVDDSGYLLTPVYRPRRRAHPVARPPRHPRLYPQHNSDMGFIESALLPSPHTPSRTGTWPQLG